MKNKSKLLCLPSKKLKYTQFCAEHPDIPIFSQPWWLDAICPGNWDVILIERNDTLVASFPFYKTKKRKIFTYIVMPQLTQKLGPYIVYDFNDETEDERIEYEHEIYNAIIDKLPQFDNFTIHFDWKYKNWLPFYWMGFKQTVRYSYILDDIKNHDNIIKNYSIKKRQKIQKSRDVLELKFDLPPDIFYNYFTDVIHERDEYVSFSIDLFNNIYNAVYDRQAGRVFYCTDGEGNIHAINLTIWDNECAYYLIAMRKKEYNTTGGTEFLVDETIKYVSQFVNRFDFEGSMIKGVEESFRFFGAHQTEYYAISKNNNVLLRVLYAIKSR